MTSDAPSTRLSALRDRMFVFHKYIRSQMPNYTSYGPSISGVSALQDELLVISSALEDEFKLPYSRPSRLAMLCEAIGSLINLREEMTELLNLWELRARRRQRGFSLSELDRDILYELLLGVEMSETRNMRSYLTRPRMQVNRERLKMLKKMYGTCSDPRIYVVTQNLARLESALDNLAELLEGAKKNSVEKTVLPIFYGVDPSDVRHQTGSFAQAFADHEIKYKDEPQKVKRSRAALTKLANLASWDSKGWY